MEKNVVQSFTSGQWTGHRCFLFGGGPSLENFDASLLANELTIGVNKSFLHFNPTINYSMDRVFFNLVTTSSEDSREQVYVDGWRKYTNHKIFISPMDGKPYSDDVLIVKRLTERCISLDLDKGIYPGSNSGFGALMLAIALGSSPILLLGYTLKVEVKPDGKKKTHFHNGYSDQNVDGFERRLVRFKTQFEEFAPDIKKLGIEVINLDVTSALDCFPKMSFEEYMGTNK
jgi:hypothetical protein